MMNDKLKLTVVAMTLACLNAAMPAKAQVRGETRITDPDVLLSMGFAKNADNVYVDDAVIQARSSGVGDEAIAQVTPTTGTDYSPILAKEFTGRIDRTGTQWRYDGGPNCCTDLSRVGTEQFAEAQFEVPSGATLNFFRFWAFDNNAADLGFFVFEVCQPAFAGGAPTATLIASSATSGTPGHTTGLVSLNRPVNNQSCTYLARVRFDAASTSLALQKVRLQFTR